MKYYKYAQNDIGYSEAYEKYRSIIISKYFTHIFASSILMVVLVFIIYRIKSNKKKQRRGKTI